MEPIKTLQPDVEMEESLQKILGLIDEKKYFVSMGLQAFFASEGAYGLKWGTIMAACCTIVFPMILLFLFGQNWILNGITNDSAVKE